MKRTRATPSFFWQGLMILLPVAVLAVVGFISLREDEQSAETDARSRAVANAQSLAQAMRASVDGELRRFLITQNEWMMGLNGASQTSVSIAFPDANLQAELDSWKRDYPELPVTRLALPHGIILADGQQIAPPTYSVAPKPPPWFLGLTPEQKRLWGNLRAGGASSELTVWRQAFADTAPSPEARQAVVDLLQPPEQMIGHSNFLPSETGISFEQIACYQLLTATNARLSSGLLQALWWQAVDHPSMVSRRLLELAGGLTNRADSGLQQKLFWMQSYFNRQGQANQLLQPLRQLPELQPWKMGWWSHWAADGSALAIFQPLTFSNSEPKSASAPLTGAGYEVWFVPRAVVAAIFKRVLDDNRSLIPEYTAPEVNAEGMCVFTKADGALAERELLAGAEQRTGNYFAQDAIHFDIKFFLTDRRQILVAERRRALLFGTLILVAALTALAGLVSARRVFERQLQLNEEKSNFVSSVSHELRAPIAAVRLMAENLERGKISGAERQGEYFRFIGQECRRLSALIENVLDISRIEQGRKQYEFEPADLGALVATTLKLMEPYATEKGVALERAASGQGEAAGPLELNVDGRAIQQALVNLIDNAVKHSARGETVTVGITSGSPVELWVADHGPGIPADEHEKIFERFHRLGSELRRETQGVGIGLSVVKHIVEAHHGRVRVESRVGAGSRFIIELPNPRPA